MLVNYDYVSAYLQAKSRSERGASLVEYALLLALIAIVCVAAVSTLGGKTSSQFSSVATGL